MKCCCIFQLEILAASICPRCSFHARYLNKALSPCVFGEKQRPFSGLVLLQVRQLWVHGTRAASGASRHYSTLKAYSTSYCRLFHNFFLFSEQNGLLNQPSLSHHSSTSSMTSSGNVPDVSNQAEEEKSEVEMKSEDRITLGSEKIKDSKGS